MKIFGIGLSRTGTTSLNRSLEILGFKTVHFPVDDVTYNELIHGQYNFSIMSHFDAYVDGIAPFYKQINEKFANAKFINTIRDEESWLKSMKKHMVYGSSFFFKGNFEKKAAECKTHRMMLFYHAATYGCVFFSDERLRFAYKNHIDQSRNYFKNNNNYLELDVCAGDGWLKLCDFLNKKIPKCIFPHKNKSKNKLL